jgi:26S proteasome regulatory subunit N4
MNQVLRDLEARKINVEKEIGVNMEVLKSNGLNFEDSVLDADGFPRDDIDVIACRHAKKNIIELRNDFREIMLKLSNELNQFYQQQQPEKNEIPAIAIIDDVQESSPASESGLLINDLLVGVYESANGERVQSQTLQSIQKLVLESENHELIFQIRRGTNMLNISVTPKRWSGRGLLGCHLRSVSKNN